MPIMRVLELSDEDSSDDESWEDYGDNLAEPSGQAWYSTPSSNLHASPAAKSCYFKDDDADDGYLGHYYSYPGNQSPRKYPPRRPMETTVMPNHDQTSFHPKEPSRRRSPNMARHSGYRHFDRFYGYTGNQYPSKCSSRSQFASSPMPTRRQANSFPKEPTRARSPSKETASRLSHDLPKVKLATPESPTHEETRNMILAYLQYWENRPHQAKCQTAEQPHVPGQEDMKEEVQLGPYQASRTTRARNGGCYKCQDPTHYARDCPRHSESSLPGTGHHGITSNIRESTRPFDPSFDIHRQVTHFGDLGQSRMCTSRVSYGEEPIMPHGHEHQDEEIHGLTRSNSPRFEIHLESEHFESFDRARIGLQGLPSSLLHKVPPGTVQQGTTPSIGEFTRTFVTSFGIQRETMYLGHLGQVIIFPGVVPRSLVHKPLLGHDQGPWSLSIANFIRSFDLGIIIRPQSGYGEDFDRGRTCPEWPNMIVGSQVPHVAVIGHHGLIKSLDQGSYGSFDSILFPNVDMKYLLHLGVTGTVSPPATPCTKVDALQGYPTTNLCVYGALQTFVWNPGGSPLQLELPEGIQWCFPVSNTTRNQAHPCSPHLIQHEEVLRFMLVVNACMHPGHLGFRFFCTNTYREVFDREKLILDRPVLRDGPKGSIPPYTGRTNPPTPSGHGNHYHGLLKHTLMSPSRPLEASASTSFVARPRALPCDITGEVLSFSLKLLLFPFDPGIDKVLRTKLQQRGGYDRCMAMAHVPTVPSGTQNRNTGAEYVPEHGSGTEHVPEHVPEHRTRNIPRIHPRFSLPKQTSQAAFIGSLDNQAMSQNPEHHHQAPNITIKPSMEQEKSGEHSKWFMKTLGRLHSFGKLDHVCLHSQVMWRHPQVIEGIGTLFPTPGLSHRVYREGFNEAMHFDASHLIPIQSLTWKHSGLVKGLKR